ncbi:MAG: hypothetical protein H0X26_06840 [Alphaproteobacteria bacterium]|nr:hypothetical protein [Alphaproteobacteria bacterium]
MLILFGTTYNLSKEKIDEKILLCASLIALYGISAQAVTFEIKDTTGDKEITFKFYAPPGSPLNVPLESSPKTKHKKDLLRYFTKIANSKRSLEISAADARCWPLQLEKYDAGQLNNTIITITRDHAHSTCEINLF